MANNMSSALDISIVLAMVAVAAVAAVALFAYTRRSGPPPDIGAGYQFADPWYCILAGLIAVSAAFAAVILFAAWAWSLADAEAAGQSASLAICCVLATPTPARIRGRARA